MSTGITAVIGNGGQPKVVATHSSGSSVEVYLHGATVTSFKPASRQEVLFVAGKAIFDGVKAIRGGIPIAFPQFAGQGSLPMHGFARTSTWAIDKVGDGLIELSLTDGESTRELWPHAFKLVYRINFDDKILSTHLEVHNTGTESFQFEALLHSYFDIGVDRVGADGVRINGLAGVRYRDKPSSSEIDETNDAFPLVGEVDRIYMNTPNDVTVTGIATGPAFNSIKISRKASIRDAAPNLKNIVVSCPLDVVVWNAGPAKAATLVEFTDGDWRRYVCVEPGRVSEKQELPAGKVYTLTQVVTPA